MDDTGTNWLITQSEYFAKQEQDARAEAKRWRKVADQAAGAKQFAQWQLKLAQTAKVQPTVKVSELEDIIGAKLSREDLAVLDGGLAAPAKSEEAL